MQTPIPAVAHTTRSFLAGYASTAPWRRPVSSPGPPTAGSSQPAGVRGRPAAPAPQRRRDISLPSPALRGAAGARPSTRTAREGNRGTARPSAWPRGRLTPRAPEA